MHYLHRSGLRRHLLSAAIANTCAATLFAAPAVLAQGTAENSDTRATLPTLQVTESRLYEEATGPVQGIAATRSATGTKTDTPIIETPQSISVVSSQEFRNYGARNVNQALGYTAGVANSYGGGGADTTHDSMMIRGFSVHTGYRDGSKYQANTFDGQQELYGLERLEVLKGPSSILYGVASPGGLINAVSKRPISEPLREVNLQVGSFDRRQVSADFSDSLDEEGQFSYRLTMLRRDSNTFIDHVPDDRTYIAPAFKWQPNEGTSLTLLSEYQRDETTYVYGLPASGTILPNPNGDIPRERFVGEPGFDDYDNESYSLGYLFEHDFSNRLKLRHNLRSFHSDRDYDLTSIVQSPESSAGRHYSRTAFDRRDASRALSSDTSLQYDWGYGATDNTTLVGLDYVRQRHETERYQQTAPSLDLYNPIYGSGKLGERIPLDYSLVNHKEQVGLYLQNQMKIADQWVFMLGGRQDWIDTESSRYFDPSQGSQQDDNAFTGRVGFVYLADNGLAPFASFSQSFEVATGSDRSGNQFEPTRGEQFEAGIRYQPEGGDTMLTASVYELTQENVLVADPVDTSFQAQIGEVRSRGVELEAKTEIGLNANLVAAYAYTDARTTKSSPATPDKVGERTGQAPYNQFSLWGDYRFGNFGLPSLKLGAGVRYVGSTLPNAYLDGKVSGFTLFDAMVSYETGSWLLSLNATNLTDKTYIESCTFACYYGEPRSIVGTASYQW
ncbi:MULTISPECIES: TonB-dependent siderophore receptor [Halomonadaceae]|uniref:TonB-dependent siderophore receptor n=1 Tax=Halomonas campaniensis TaxID=213554 RepID=A0A3D0KGW3_9GAMM|nr:MULTISPECIES: TonB-dependent siderophore receptor [Halomonas]HBS82754.1 TonB-dependent siderophore receptor [Halomonas campaniensis]HCA02768.1 TonB-dependent siderophore receptor [Halomonas campaniensis]